MSDETGIVKKIWLSLRDIGTFFRLNSGQGWVGKGKPTRLSDGSVLLQFGRPIALGFAYANTKPVKGPGDLTGWITVRITEEMVGKEIAVFASVEVKNSNGGTTSDDQHIWRDNVNNAGGIAIVANTEEQAQELIEKSLERFNV